MKSIYLFLLFPFLSPAIQAQKKTITWYKQQLTRTGLDDSLKAVYNFEMGEAHASVNATEAIKYYREALTIAKKIESHRLLFWSSKIIKNNH